MSSPIDLFQELYLEQRERNKALEEKRNQLLEERERLGNELRSAKPDHAVITGDETSASADERPAPGDDNVITHRDKEFRGLVKEHPIHSEHLSKNMQTAINNTRTAINNASISAEHLYKKLSTGINDASKHAHAMQKETQSLRDAKIASNEKLNAAKALNKELHEKLNAAKALTKKLQLENQCLQAQLKLNAAKARNKELQVENQCLQDQLNLVLSSEILSSAAELSKVKEEISKAKEELSEANAKSKADSTKLREENQALREARDQLLGRKKEVVP